MAEKKQPVVDLDILEESEGYQDAKARLDENQRNMGDTWKHKIATKLEDGQRVLVSLNGWEYHVGKVVGIAGDFEEIASVLVNWIVQFEKPMENGYKTIIVNDNNLEPF